MAALIPDPLRTFLAAPNPAVMATVTSRGRPVAVATWYVLEPSGSILFSLTPDRVRMAHIRRDPRIALDVLHPGDIAANLHPYRSVSLQLTVASITEDDDFRDVDAVSLHYIGIPFPDHEWPRVGVRATIDRFFVDGDLLDPITTEVPRPVPRIAPWYLAEG